LNKKEVVQKIFTKRTFFEKEVLLVKSENDRLEIMSILSKKLVDETLKEHLNFQYIKEFSDFTLKHIVNMLFKEIANEWIFYAMDILKYSKDEALDELQPKHRVIFIHSLALSYYKFYKDFIYENISESFIELLSTSNYNNDKKNLVNTIINSDLIANRKVLGINNFEQLHKRVKSAKNFKSIEITSYQTKIAEILDNIENTKLDEDKKNNLFRLVSKYEKKVSKLENQKLEAFDATLKRVKNAIFNSLKNGIFKDF
jgi:hypothetical protein